jgi:hypothetical protein
MQSGSDRRPQLSTHMKGWIEYGVEYLPTCISNRNGHSMVFPEPGCVTNSQRNERHRAYIVRRVEKTLNCMVGYPGYRSTRYWVLVLEEPKVHVKVGAPFY